MSKDLEFTINLACKAGEEIIGFKDKNFKITEKPHEGLVTDADLASEKIILESIKKYYPNDLILSEESYNNLDSSIFLKNRVWVIDPLDGTSNFINHQPFYSVSIALVVNGKPTLGVVRVPELNETFYAEIGCGAYLKKETLKKINMVNNKELKRCLYVTNVTNNKKNNDVVDYTAKLFRKSLSGRKLGSATLDMCYTSLGWYDYCIQNNIKAWDMAASYIIALESGLKVTNLMSDEFSILENSIFIRPKHLDKEFFA